MIGPVYLLHLSAAHFKSFEVIHVMLTNIYIYIRVNITCITSKLLKCGCRKISWTDCVENEEVLYIYIYIAYLCVINDVSNSSYIVWNN